MKKVILVHGWGGNSDGGWFAPLKKELEKNNCKVFSPEMPDTFHPKIKDWTAKLREFNGIIDENTFFIGHSIGCQAIMRLLENSNKKVGGAIFVAGWFNLTDETWDETYTPEIAKEWIETPINFDKIKKNTPSILVINSDDDSYVPLSDLELFKKNLNAEILILNNRKHIEELTKKEMEQIIEFIKKG